MYISIHIYTQYRRSWKITRECLWDTLCLTKPEFAQAGLNRKTPREAERTPQHQQLSPPAGRPQPQDAM